MKALTPVPVLVFLLFASFTMYAQEYAPLPSGFGNMVLGMEIEQAKETLRSESHFLYRGDPDVSLLPQADSSIIECRGQGFIDEASFQFYDEKLFIIILLLNPDEIDFFSMYTALTEKYGPSAYLDPEQVLWNDEKIRLSLERPLTVKYIDWAVFSELRKNAAADESFRATARTEFIELF